MNGPQGQSEWWRGRKRAVSSSKHSLSTELPLDVKAWQWPSIGILGAVLFPSYVWKCLAQARLSTVDPTRLDFTLGTRRLLAFGLEQGESDPYPLKVRSKKRGMYNPVPQFQILVLQGWWKVARTVRVQLPIEQRPAVAFIFGLVALSLGGPSFSGKYSLTTDG